MASKKRKKSSDKQDEEPTFEKLDLDPEPELEADTAPPPKEPAPIVAPTPAKPVKAKREILYTADRFFAGRRRSNPIADAFLRVERLNHRTRKLTAAEWEAEWSNFLTAKR